MSSEHVAWVFRHSTAKGAAFQVHLAVADSCNDANDHRFWMKMAKTADKARVSRAAAQKAMSWLRENGYLELLSDEDRRRAGVPAEYRFLFPDVDVVFETRRRTSRPEREEVAMEARGTSRRGREDLATTSRVELEGNPNEEPKGERAVWVLRFDEHFWPAYPARNGKKLDKGKALAQWMKLSIDDQRAAVKGARNYAASGQLPKDAHRWLRDRCWVDWQTPGLPGHEGGRPRSASLSDFMGEIADEMGGA